jgi:hypothetical protein
MEGQMRDVDSIIWALQRDAKYLAWPRGRLAEAKYTHAGAILSENAFLVFGTRLKYQNVPTRQS